MKAETLYSEGDYLQFLTNIQDNFAIFNGPFFTTDVDPAYLWQKFLMSFPPSVRQTYNCHACRHFIERYGGLVTINSAGMTVPVMWPMSYVKGTIYELPVVRCWTLVDNARVTGVFVSKLSILGEPETHHKVKGYFHHMTAILKREDTYEGRLEANQVVALKSEEYGMLCRGLDEFKLSVARQAASIAASDQLYRSERVKGVADWFLALHEKLAATRDPAHKDNIIWQTVASAPSGWCHIRSTMIGTLLDDIKSGLGYTEIERRFREKMSPYQYQRPQAPPRLGNIEQAEKLVKELGIEPSLKRRFARLDELDLLWRPKVRQVRNTTDGVFSHLTPRQPSQPRGQDVDVPAVTMTWVKFQGTVLPTAERIEYMVPGGKEAFCAYTGPVYADAPVIHQWGNPYSWYVYGSGSYAATWNLKSYQYVDVTGVSLKPSMWNKFLEHQGKGVLFVLEGCKDTEHEGKGSGLFPDQLKSDLHEIRATIEAYSNSDSLEGYEQADACGIMLFANHAWNAQFRVTANGVVMTYKLDRWD